MRADARNAPEIIGWMFLCGMVLLESWKFWLGFGLFRRLSGNSLIGFIYVVSALLSFFPLLSWIACAIGNSLAGKAVEKKLGKKPSTWVYFGWIGLYHLQGLLNEAAAGNTEPTAQPQLPPKGEQISSGSPAAAPNEPHIDKSEFEKIMSLVVPRVGERLREMIDNPTTEGHQRLVEFLKEHGGTDGVEKYRRTLLSNVMSVCDHAYSVAVSQTITRIPGAPDSKGSFQKELQSWAIGSSALRLGRALDIRAAMEVYKPFARMMEDRDYLLAVVRKNEGGDGTFTATVNPADYESHASPEIAYKLMIQADFDMFESDVWAYVAYYAGDEDFLSRREKVAAKLAKDSIEHWTKQAETCIREMGEIKAKLVAQVSERFTKMIDNPGKRHQGHVDFLKENGGAEDTEKYKQKLLSLVIAVCDRAYSDHSSPSGPESNGTFAKELQRWAANVSEGRLTRGVDIATAMMVRGSTEQIFQDRDYLLAIVWKHAGEGSVGLGKLDGTEYETLTGPEIANMLNVRSYADTFESELFAHATYYAGDEEFLAKYGEREKAVLKCSVEYWQKYVAQIEQERKAVRELAKRVLEQSAMSFQDFVAWDKQLRTLFSESQDGWVRREAFQMWETLCEMWVKCLTQQGKIEEAKRLEQLANGLKAGHKEIVKAKEALRQGEPAEAMDILQRAELGRTGHT